MKRIAMQIVVLILFLLNISFSQSKKFSPQEVRSDLQFMIDKMEETHVNLYAVYPKEEFYSELKQLNNSLKDSLNKIEIWKLAAPLIAKLGDGHTGLRLPQDEMMQFLIKDGKLFPLSVNIDGDKLLIAEDNKSNTEIPNGSEIISINGISTKTLIDSMRKFVSGEKESFKNTSVCFAFGPFLWAIFNMSADFEIEYKAPNDSSIKTKIIEGKNKDEVMRNAMKTTVFQNPYSLKLIGNDSIAYINFKSFSNRDICSKFLDTTFSTIKEMGIKNLIIDIRKNGGGDSGIGDMFFNYITDKPYCQFMRADVKTDGEIKTYENELTVPDNPENKFNGNVYLLTSNATFSSANSFSSAFKCYKMGTIVGEETGGITTPFGDVKSFNMPITNMLFGVSYKRFREACGKEDNRGVIPDYEVKQNPEDSANGIDTVLEFTKKLIWKNQHAN